MPTSWNIRSPPSTSWTLSRLGGSYLTNSIGEYIVTNNNERIIVIVPGGALSITTWTPRTTI